MDDSYYSRRAVTAFAALYCLAFLPILLIPGYFFDSWGWRDPALSAQSLHDIGRPLIAETFRLFYAADRILNPYVQATSLFSFVSGLASWLCLFQALRLLRVFRVWEIFWIVSLSALSPFNFSRVLVTQYQLVFLLFSIGVLLFVMAIVRRNFYLRVAAAIFFFASCQVESFYFATVATLVLAMLHDRSQSDAWGGIELRRVLKLSLRYGELVLVPVLAFAVREIFFKRSGLYAHYNAIGLMGLIKGIPSAFVSAVNAIYMTVASLGFLGSPGYGVSGYYAVVIAVIVITAGIVLLIGSGESEQHHAHSYAPFLALVVLAFLIYPYSVVNGGRTIVPLSNWDDRSFLTAQFALGFVIYGLIVLLVRAEYRQVLLIATLALAISSTVFGYLGLVREGHLQDGLVFALKDNAKIKENHTFIYVDNEAPLWLNRTMRFYEWNQMFFNAYGDYKRLALQFSLDPSSNQTNDLSTLIKDDKQHGEFGFRDYQGGGPVMELQWLVPNKMSPQQLVRLSYLRIFKPDLYRTEAENLVRLWVTPSPVTIH